MPQTTSARRARWPEGDSQAIQFLTAQGFGTVNSCFWVLPSTDYKTSEEEEDAIRYLIEEWDWGGIAEPVPLDTIAAHGTLHSHPENNNEKDIDMGAFSGMKDAKRGFDSNYLKSPGQYLVRIDEIAFFDYTGGGGVRYEMFKITITNLLTAEGDTKPGEICSVGFSLGGKIPKNVFQGKVKNFICNVLEVEEEQVGEAETLACIGEDSPLKGLVCSVTARNRVSKDKVDEKTGEAQEFATFSWSPAFTKQEIIDALADSPGAIAKYFPNGVPDKDAS